MAVKEAIEEGGRKRRYFPMAHRKDHQKTDRRFMKSKNLLEVKSLVKAQMLGLKNLDEIKLEHQSLENLDLMLRSEVV